MALFKTKTPIAEQTSETVLKVPRHVAIIMDGNGRWAKSRMMPRVAGHKAGMQTVKTIAKAASAAGVQVLSLYAFSTENWSRPNDEVSFLMKLPIDFFNDFVPDLIANNIRVQVIGDISGLPVATQDAVNRAIKQTAQGTGMVLNFALNYGGRHEIIQAAKRLAQQVADGAFAPDDINETLFANALTTGSLGELSDPDLVIRTSGELRLSNFLPYQTAYSELYFTQTQWPDFSQEDLQAALQAFSQRQRRFGGLKEEEDA